MPENGGSTGARVSSSPHDAPYVVFGLLAGTSATAFSSGEPSGHPTPSRRWSPCSSRSGRYGARRRSGSCSPLPLRSAPGGCSRTQRCSACSCRRRQEPHRRGAGHPRRGRSGRRAGPALGGVLITLVGPARALVSNRPPCAAAPRSVRCDGGRERDAGGPSRSSVPVCRRSSVTPCWVGHLLGLRLERSSPQVPGPSRFRSFARSSLSSRHLRRGRCRRRLMGVLAPRSSALDWRIGGLRILVRGIPVAALATAMSGLSEGLAPPLPASPHSSWQRW